MATTTREAALRYKGRLLNTTAGRPFRTRYESFEESVPLDLEQPPSQNFRQIFSVALDSPKNADQHHHPPSTGDGRNPNEKEDEGEGEGRVKSLSMGSSSLIVRVAHLNNLVKLLVGLRKGPSGTKHSWGFTKLELLAGLRCLLFDEDKDIRASAMRCLRHLIETVEDLYLALQLHIDTLVARSLDLVLDNRVERVQSLRLINHLLNIYCSHRHRHETVFKPKTTTLTPSCRDPVLPDSKFSFPNTLLRPLIALSLDGLESDTGSSVGFSGQDKLCRAATAQVCEMAVKCGCVVLNCAGTGWVVRALLGSICSQPRLGEVVAAVAVRWLDNPRYRSRRDVRLLLQELIAPLTDAHYKLLGGNPEKDEGRVRLQLRSESEYLLDHCKVALQSVLRTWPGLLGSLSDSHLLSTGLRHSPLEILVDSLAILQSERTRDVILELFCELLQLPYATEHFDTWNRAINYLDYTGVATDPYRYSLSQGFVCAEAFDFLPNVAREEGRPNLIGQFQALTLFALVQAGLTKALVRVILLNPDHPVCIKGTLLMGFLLDKAGKLLPAHWRQVALSLPTLIQAYCDRAAADTVCPSVAAQHKSSGLQDTRARSGSDTMVAPLPPGQFRKVLKEYAHLLCDRLHEVSMMMGKKKTPQCFLLERLIQRPSSLLFSGTQESSKAQLSLSQPELPHSGHGSSDSLFAPHSPRGVSSLLPNIFGRQASTTSTGSQGGGAGGTSGPLDANLHDKIRESRAAQPYTNPMTGWDWELVDMGLSQLWECLNKQEEDRSLLRHLDDSTCGKFLNNLLQFYWPQHGQFGKLSEDWKAYARSGSTLMKVAAKFPKDSVVWGSLRNFLTDLNQNLVQDRLYTGFLSTKHLVTSATVEYFTFIGELSTTDHGLALLERTGTLQRLLDVINEDTDIIYVKLMVSCLDYAKPSLARTVLQKLLTSTKEAGRRYATEHLRVLGRLRVENFEDWGVEMGCLQLADRSPRVVMDAVSVLEEVLWNPRNMESFAKMRAMVLLNLGEAGVMLRSHWFFAPSQLHTEEEDKLWAAELLLWHKEFNVQYVDVVEEKMREGHTLFVRAGDGSFPRHSNERWILPELPVPSHLYGHLAKHLAGCQLMLGRNCVVPLIDTVQYGSLDSEAEIRNMKAAIWALGHIGTTDLGCVQLLPQVTVPCLVKMAEECPVLSVRGVALWALNLLAQSNFGAQRLRELGWESSLESGIIPGKSWKFRARKLTMELEGGEEPQLCEHQRGWNATRSGISGSVSAQESPRQEPETMVRRPRSVGMSESRPASVATCGSCEICHPKVEEANTKIRAERLSERSREPSFSDQGTVAELILPRSPTLLPFEASPVFVACCEETPSVLTGTTGTTASVFLTASDENLLTCSRPGRSHSFGAQEAPQTETASLERKESGRRKSFTGEEEGDDAFPDRLPRPLPRPKKIGEKYAGSSVGSAASSGLGSVWEHGSHSEDSRKSTSGHTLAPVPSNNHTRSQSFGGVTPLKAAGAGKKRHASTVSGDSGPAKDRTGSLMDSSALTSGIGSLESRLAYTPVPSPQGGTHLSALAHVGAPDPFGTVYQDYFFDRRKVEDREEKMNRSPVREVDHCSAELRKAMSLKAVPRVRRVLPRLLNEVAVGEFGRRRDTMRPQFMQDADAVGYEIFQNLDEGKETSSDEERNSAGKRLEETYSEIATGYEKTWDELRGEDSDGTGHTHSDSSTHSKDVLYCLPVDIQVLTTNIMECKEDGGKRAGGGEEVGSVMRRPRSRSSKHRDPAEIQGIKAHLAEHCLHCSATPAALRHTDSESGLEDTSSYSSPSRSRTGTQASQNSVFSTESVSESGFSDASNKILVRKEILRLICQLTVRPKYAERGLLKLRQECPGFFSTICLYCDISCVITGYQFKLASRRFIQELFQDVDFSELSEESLKLFGRPEKLEASNNDQTVVLET